MTKYDEVMEKLEVTPEMRARILQNVETQMAEPQKPNRLRRFAALAACLAVLLVGGGAVKTYFQPRAGGIRDDDRKRHGRGSVKEELSEAVGFPVKSAQSLPFLPQSIYYTSYWGEMAQIDYANGGSTACFRQSLGEEDNSGDWSEYPAQKSLTVNGCAVTLKGKRTAIRLPSGRTGPTAIRSACLPVSRPPSGNLLLRG